MGFFSREEVAQGEALSSEPLCIRCGLKKRASPLGVTGKGGKGILLVFSTPTDKEAQAGTHWIEQKGMVRKELAKLGIDVERDCWRIDAVQCRPPKRGPSADEVDACRPALFRAVKDLRPEKVLLFDDEALEAFIGHRWDGGLGGIQRWRGLSFPDREHRCWCYPMLSPGFIHSESEKYPVLPTTFRADLSRAIEDEPPTLDWDERLESQFSIITSPEEVNRRLREYCRETELVAFDYETTGIKPYAKGHAVYTASIASGKLGGMSFPMLPELRAMWVRFLGSQVPKTAHHLKFEEVWSKTFFGIPVRNWVWCSMEAAHLIDNRRKICDLKFQAFLHFGYRDWGVEVESYLRSDSEDEGANAKNRIQDAPLRKLLTYGGKDAVLQLRLAQRQREILGVRAG